jgi:hypothetical protein
MSIVIHPPLFFARALRTFAEAAAAFFARALRCAAVIFLAVVKPPLAPIKRIAFLMVDSSIAYRYAIE